MRAYCCLSKRADPDPRFCGMKNINIDRLDYIVWNAVAGLVKNSDRLENAITLSKVNYTKDIVTLEAQLEFVRNELKDRQRQLERMIRLYSASQTITPMDLDVQVRKLKEESIPFESDMDKISRSLMALKTSNNQNQSVRDWAKSVAANVDNLSQEEQHELLDLLTKKIVVDWDAVQKCHHVQIEAALPLFGRNPAPTTPLPGVSTFRGSTEAVN